MKKLAPNPLRILDALRGRESLQEMVDRILDRYTRKRPAARKLERKTA